MKITDFENRRSFKCIWLNSQFREEVSKADSYTLAVICVKAGMSHSLLALNNTTLEQSCTWGGGRRRKVY